MMNLNSLNLSSLDALRPMLPVPMWQKLAALTAGFTVIIVVYLYFVWMPIQDDIAGQQVRLEREKVLLKKNKKLAQDLPRKQAEYAKLEQQLKVALNMLPKKSQIPDLLDNVSWAGKDSGLEFSEFKPQEEVVKQIYAEVPVSLKVSGSYKQLLTFLKRVGEMPRIVDVKGLKLAPAKGGGNLLDITGKAVTYRFIEQAQNQQPTAPKRRR